ncbi:hypothetical protein [Actinomadura sp. 3N508]|uniref:phage tail tube protein n=1 Tax=Actinomadura sp. 3N508 TaxID=3375153 RepID=UPI0037B7B34F
MADNVTWIRVGVGPGKVRVSPLATIAPTNPTDAYGAGWNDLGALDPAGLSEGVNEDRAQHTPWGYKSPVRTDITSSTRTYKFKCWETNVHTLSLFDRVAYEDMTIVGAGPSAYLAYDVVRPNKGDERSFAIDLIDGDDNYFRYIIPRGEVTERTEITWKGDEVVGYEYTVTAYESSDGLTVRKYIQAGIVLPA